MEVFIPEASLLTAVLIMSRLFGESRSSERVARQRASLAPALAIRWI
jgi:hypothetical protein